MTLNTSSRNISIDKNGTRLVDQIRESRKRKGREEKKEEKRERERKEEGETPIKEKYHSRWPN
jgi:hypothetical protein